MVAPITIGDDVWIAAHCVIVRGVHIGSGAVVAAMSVVREDVPRHAVVVGVAAQVKGSRAPADAGGPLSG